MTKRVQLPQPGLINRGGLIVSPLEAYKAWDSYSDSMCAGFMTPPQPDGYGDGDDYGGRSQWDCDQEIKEIVKYHLEKINNNS